MDPGLESAREVEAREEEIAFTGDHPILHGPVRQRRAGVDAYPDRGLEEVEVKGLGKTSTSAGSIIECPSGVRSSSSSHDAEGVLERAAADAAEADGVGHPLIAPAR